ncbi:MAG: hypothetical protein WC843_05735 [Candidatus Gracilibacteria bacterium]|jgi:hypothetical protein
MRKLDAAALALSMSLAGNGCIGENTRGHSAEIEHIGEQTQALINSYGQLQSAPFANPNAIEGEPSFLPKSGKYDHKILFVSDRFSAPKKVDILSTKFDGVSYSTPQAVLGLNDPVINEQSPLICVPIDGCPTPKILFNSNTGGPTKSRVRDFIEGDGVNPDSAPANTEVVLGNNINTLGTFFRPSAIHNGYIYGGWDPNVDYNIARFKVAEMLNNPKPELIKGASDPNLDETHISFNGDGTVLLTTAPTGINQGEISECEFDEVNIAVQNCQKVPSMSGNPATQANASHITGTNLVVLNDSNTPNFKPQIKIATITSPKPDGGAPDGGISDAGVDAGADSGAPDSGADAGSDAGAQDGGVDGGSQDAGVGGAGGAGGAAPDAGQGGQSPDGGAAGAGGKGQGGAGGIGGGLNTGGHAGQGGSPAGGQGQGGSAGGPAEDGGAGGSTPDSGTKDAGSDAETPTCTKLENGTIVDNAANLKLSSCQPDGSFEAEVLGPVTITTKDGKEIKIFGITKGQNNTIKFTYPNGFIPGAGIVNAGFLQEEHDDGTDWNAKFLGGYLGADGTGWVIASEKSTFDSAVKLNKMTAKEAESLDTALKTLNADTSAKFVAIHQYDGSSKFCYPGSDSNQNCTNVPDDTNLYLKVQGGKVTGASDNPDGFTTVKVDPVKNGEPEQPGSCGACEVGPGAFNSVDHGQDSTYAALAALTILGLAARRKNRATA